MSRYDYRDPATDPAYCDGLAPDEPVDEPDGPTCTYCSAPIPWLDNNEPYCSALCACYAARDNQEDRQ